MNMSKWFWLLARGTAVLALSPQVARAQGEAFDYEQLSPAPASEPGAAPSAPRTLSAKMPDRSRSAEDDARATHHSVALDVPRVAYTDSAFGVSPSTFGAGGFGEVRNGVNNAAEPHLGGGLRLWGSPVDRLLFVFDAQRNPENDRFAPALTAQVRLLGSDRQGYAFGVLARYKAEGFAELGGEIETGLLGSYVVSGLHLDANLLAGADFEGGQSDGEILTRAGYDVFTFLRVGAEGRIRDRLSGKVQLPGNRSWDAFAGPQVLAYFDHYFGAVTGGPSTVGISDKLGWSVIASAGGVMF